jgi:murein DD-endopeptidase MepM/ murein hydrolase activator NlpD
MTRAWLVVCLALSARAGAQSDSVRTWGRRYTDWFFGDHLNELYARFADKYHDAADSAKLVALHDRVHNELGAKQLVVSETLTPRGPYTVYEQTVTVEKIVQLVIVRSAIDSTGRIGAFVVLPSQVTEAVSAFMDYKTKTPLRLPFTGTWQVLWGGRTLADNQHASLPDQRFAYDFVVGTNGGCAGRPVLAPGEGTIVDLVDSVHDNAPGDFNNAAPLGNYVVIDHGNGEFSFLAHLQSHSVSVKRGQHVARGAVLGRCGASGQVAGPVLHYHMQTTPSFMVGAGMPAQFQAYVADGKPVDRGEPRRGQSISPAP